MASKLTVAAADTLAASDTSEENLALLPEDPEVLDWDAGIETPPPRPMGTVLVKLEFQGRDKPVPVENPESG